MGCMRERAGCFCFAGAWAGGGEGGKGRRRTGVEVLAASGALFLGSWGREGGTGTVHLKFGAEMERGLRIAA